MALSPCDVLTTLQMPMALLLLLKQALIHERHTSCAVLLSLGVVCLYAWVLGVHLPCSPNYMSISLPLLGERENEHTS